MKKNGLFGPSSYNVIKNDDIKYTMAARQPMPKATRSIDFRKCKNEFKFIKLLS